MTLLIEEISNIIFKNRKSNDEEHGQNIPFPTYEL